MGGFRDAQHYDAAHATNAAQCSFKHSVKRRMQNTRADVKDSSTVCLHSINPPHQLSSLKLR